MDHQPKPAAPPSTQPENGGGVEDGARNEPYHDITRRVNKRPEGSPFEDRASTTGDSRFRALIAALTELALASPIGDTDRLVEPPTLSDSEVRAILVAGIPAALRAASRALDGQLLRGAAAVAEAILRLLRQARGAYTDAKHAASSFRRFLALVVKEVRRVDCHGGRLASADTEPIELTHRDLAEEFRNDSAAFTPEEALIAMEEAVERERRREFFRTVVRVAIPPQDLHEFVELSGPRADGLPRTVKERGRLCRLRSKLRGVLAEFGFGSSAHDAECACSACARHRRWDHDNRPRRDQRSVRLAMRA